MSPEPSPAAGAAVSPLTPEQQRVLGVLVEKAKTTSDAYPMTLNALVTGCNQKSNRDPVTDYNDDEVERALAELQGAGLVVKVTSTTGRVERWRHQLYDRWGVNKVELAVLAELLLRGPQTEGELRGRASRMEPIESLEALREVLRGLAGRGMVLYLTPEGRRGTTVTHGFSEPGELERQRAAATSGAAAGPEPRPARQSAGEVEELRAEVATLREEVARLAGELAELRRALGVGN